MEKNGIKQEFAEWGYACDLPLEEIKAILKKGITDDEELKEMDLLALKIKSCRKYRKYRAIIRTEKIRKVCYPAIEKELGSYSRLPWRTRQVVDVVHEQLSNESFLITYDDFQIEKILNLHEHRLSRVVRASLNHEKFFDDLYQTCKFYDMTIDEMGVAYRTCVNILKMYDYEYAKSILWDPYVFNWIGLWTLNIYFPIHEVLSDTRKEDIMEAWSEWRREHVKHVAFCTTKNTGTESICLHH